MAKNKWQELQEEFLREHLSTGITAQDWCKKKGLNYQSARRYIKPSAAQSAQGQQRSHQHHVRSNRNAQNSANSKSGNVNDDNGKLNTSDDGESDTNSTHDHDGRDTSGRFTKGNRGNPNPVMHFRPGNQAARKHGIYSKYLNADDLFEAAEGASLEDELLFTRARTLSLTKTIQRMNQDLLDAESVEQRIELYNNLLKADAALERLTARAESLEGSLSKLWIDSIAGPRLIADTDRIKAATAKLRAETEKLTSENVGVTTALTDVVNSVRGDGVKGVISK